MRGHGRWTGTALVVVTLWLACGVAMSGCTKGKQRAALTTKLEQRIQAASATGGDFLLAEVTDFDWDTLHIFTPYVGAEEVRKWLGIDWSGARDVPELECLLVFVKGGEVVMDVDFSRLKGDFSSIRKSRFTREEARFTAPKDGKVLTHASDTP